MGPPGDSKQKAEEEAQAEIAQREEDKSFTVSDRRHWARRQRGDELAEPTEPKERLPTYVEELKAEAEEKDATLREYIASYKKVKEEMEAARARLAQDMERRLERDKQEFFAGLLPVLDNMERALATGENHQDYEGLLKGIIMVRDLFLQRLQSEGIERIASVGEPFDPAIHEAMDVVAVEAADQDNKVVEELCPGYLYRDHLLRAAQVRVGRYAAGSPKGD
ncbi:MAG: nucleotide exchange factor GrpE [Nitrospinae bacterium]|nr:nucleotide exchange factor GrpE [Nitrospinota bacterium]